MSLGCCFQFLNQFWNIDQSVISCSIWVQTLKSSWDRSHGQCCFFNHKEFLAEHKVVRIGPWPPTSMSSPAACCLKTSVSPPARSLVRIIKFVIVWSFQTYSPSLHKILQQQGCFSPVISGFDCEAATASRWYIVNTSDWLLGGEKSEGMDMIGFLIFRGGTVKEASNRKLWQMDKWIYLPTYLPTPLLTFPPLHHPALGRCFE